TRKVQQQKQTRSENLATLSSSSLSRVSLRGQSLVRVSTLPVPTVQRPVSAALKLTLSKQPVVSSQNGDLSPHQRVFLTRSIHGQAFSASQVSRRCLPGVRYRSRVRPHKRRMEPAR